MRHFVMLGTGLWLLGMCAGASAVAQTMDPEAARLAFEAADTDGDGDVSEAELAADAAAGFVALDANEDGVLEMDELTP